jgi:hypothetical protein
MEFLLLQCSSGLALQAATSRSGPATVVATFAILSSLARRIKSVAAPTLSIHCEYHTVRISVPRVLFIRRLQQPFARIVTQSHSPLLADKGSWVRTIGYRMGPWSYQQAFGA